MKRFIDLRNQGCAGRFAWYDTIVDQFESYSDQWVWHTWDEFFQDVEICQAQIDLNRYRSLTPEWAFKPPPENHDDYCSEEVDVKERLEEAELTLKEKDEIIEGLRRHINGPPLTRDNCLGLLEEIARPIPPPRLLTDEELQELTEAWKKYAENEESEGDAAWLVYHTPAFLEHISIQGKRVEELDAELARETAFLGRRLAFRTEQALKAEARAKMLEAERLKFSRAEDEQYARAEKTEARVKELNAELKLQKEDAQQAISILTTQVAERDAKITKLEAKLARETKFLGGWLALRTKQALKSEARVKELEEQQKKEAESK